MLPSLVSRVRPCPAWTIDRDDVFASRATHASRIATCRAPRSPWSTWGTGSCLEVRKSSIVWAAGSTLAPQASPEVFSYECSRLRPLFPAINARCHVPAALPSPPFTPHPPSSPYNLSSGMYHGPTHDGGGGQIDSFEQDYVLDVFADLDTTAISGNIQHFMQDQGRYGLDYGGVSVGNSKPPRPPKASQAKAKKLKRPEVSVTSSSLEEEDDDDEEEEEEEEDEGKGTGGAGAKRARLPVKRKKPQEGQGDDQSIVSEDPAHFRNSAVAAKERRRERNKVLARKTRVKKKAELELLRDQVNLLQAENGRLRKIVKARLPSSVGAHLLCAGDLDLPDAVAAAVQIMVQKAETSHGQLFVTLKSAQRSFCISNAQARDQPIVYASPGFVQLTGYPPAEILGRNCRFLQGPGTDAEEVAKMRLGIEKGEEVHVTLLNYRKDGQPFMNHIQVAPMVDHSGKTAFIIGVQCKVSLGGGAGEEFSLLHDTPTHRQATLFSSLTFPLST